MKMHACLVTILSYVITSAAIAADRAVATSSSSSVSFNVHTQDALLKEHKDLEEELLEERRKALVKMQGKSEAERAAIFEELASSQREKRQRLRELAVKSYEHRRVKQDEELRKWKNNFKK